MELLKLFIRKFEAYIAEDPERDRRHDKWVALAFLVFAFLVVFGVAEAIQRTGSGGQPADFRATGRPTGTTVRTDPLGRLETTTTLDDMALPTGEAKGPTTTVTETTIPFAEELPDEATSEPFAERGPGRPSGLSPASGASVRSLAPLLRWTERAGATAYYVEIADDPSVSSDGYYSKPLAFDDLVSGGSWRPPAIGANGTYYWHVAVGIKGRYEPRFSSSYRVNITASPSVNGPSGGEKVSQQEVRLSWDELDGAETYQVEISEGSGRDAARGFDSFVRREQNIKDTEYSPPRDLPPGRYFWHVRGLDAGAARGAFSPVSSFEVVEENR